MSDEEPEWFYGFTDTEGTYDKPIAYVYGILPFKSLESCEHTARKSVWGQPVYWRRKTEDGEWERVPDPT